MKYFNLGYPVLEIGSSERFYPHSHVLVEKFLADSEHGAQLETGGRPLVVSEITDLPFKDGVFAYSITKQVIENVEAPGKAFSELMRLSRKGYIEFRSALMEFLESSRDDHLWLVRKEIDHLLLIPGKKTRHIQYTITRELIRKNFAFRLFCKTNPDLFLTRFTWRGQIAFEVEKRPFHPDEYLPLIRQNLIGFLFQFFRQWWNSLLREVFKLVVARRKKVDIAPLIRCPRCGKDLQIENRKIICLNCKGFYPRKANVYFLSREYFSKGL